jgi:hypothetical protein
MARHYKTTKRWSNELGNNLANENRWVKKVKEYNAFAWIMLVKTESLNNTAEQGLEVTSHYRVYSKNYTTA